MSEIIQKIVGDGEDALITMDTLHEHLQLPSGDDDAAQIAFTTELAEQAASAVAADLDLPILPVLGQVMIVPYAATTPLMVDDQFALDAVAARTPEPPHGLPTRPVTWNDDPTTTPEQLNRLTEKISGVPAAASLYVLAPADGWPAAEITIVYRRGLLTSFPHLRALRALVALTTARLWEGAPAIPSSDRSIYNRLATPLRDLGGPPDGWQAL